MDAARALLRTSLLGLATGLVLLGGGLVAGARGLDASRWYTAHGTVLVLGCVLPGLAALHAHTLQRLAATTFDAARANAAAWLWLAGALLAALGQAWFPAWRVAPLLGVAALTAGATMWSVQVMKDAPRSGLTDVARDKLTKGDDACLKHVHFAHRFLPLGVLLLVASHAVAALASASPWSGRLHLAAIHILVVGYGLLSIYGLSHLWVPRLSGIPAIAAGAIKGELHSTLLGIVGITAGFLVGATTPVGRGLLVGLGPMVFLGFFVWMGVLGANIMKNKSPTNSVRPEFVYIPWVFSAVFWLVTAVLMGIFLNVLPGSLAQHLPALRFTHLHVGLLGGATQLLLGLGTRLLPLLRQAPPPRFGSTMKGSFYLFNGGLALAIYGRFAGPDDPWLAVAAALIALSLLAYARAMAPFINRRVPAHA